MRQRLQTVALALCVALLILGFGLCVAALPVTTSLLSQAYSESELAGLSRERMQEVALEVHGFTVFGKPETLPGQMEGRSGFDATAVSHLEDVRSVLWGAFAALALVLPAAAALGWGLVRGGNKNAAGTALLGGSAALLAAALTLTIWAAVDFDTFFVAFHSLFFADGTWLFDPSSLLILTFPEPFWMGMGVVWGVASMIAAVACAVVGFRVKGIPR